VRKFKGGLKRSGGNGKRESSLQYWSQGNIANPRKQTFTKRRTTVESGKKQNNPQPYHKLAKEWSRRQYSPGRAEGEGVMRLISGADELPY